MTPSILSQELTWRGFVNQTTYKSPSALDGEPITFYLGVDPSADSMTIGNLAVMMMIRHFISHGHKAILLVGGATGMIGDPDGKAQERDLKTLDEIARNKAGIAAQFTRLFDGQAYEMVDNYDWFKVINYLDFLRLVGKHVPMSAMLGREFVQSRLGAEGVGISYAEFSYSLIQGYDFLHLHREHGATLQIAGADQWGNCIAGVDLIRRTTGDEAHVWSAPLIINKSTGVKFGKSETGAVWLDASKTTPTQFYQFWINLDDAGVEDYLKVYTLFGPDEVAAIVAEHQQNPQARIAQTRLAEAVTEIVHGLEAVKVAQEVTAVLIGKTSLAEVSDSALTALRQEIPTLTGQNHNLIDLLVSSGLASSGSEARRLILGNAISINGQKTNHDTLQTEDFINGRLLLRRGKAFKDSALIELQQ
jgi:tyrosyl-tRNA synthetase